MKKTIIAAIMACGVIAPHALAQKFSLKPHANIGLGNAIQFGSSLKDMTSKSGSTAFGVDFGYKFWEAGSNSLQVNVGLGYRTVSNKLALVDLDFHYSAPASADMDGNPYERYTKITDLGEKESLGFIEIPIYLQYKYRAIEWLGIYAQAGFAPSFKCSSKLNSVSGSAFSYGIYPEYDNLMIDASYLNDFGERNLADAKGEEPSVKSAGANVLVGAGFEFNITKMIAVDLGICYDVGLTSIYEGKFKDATASSFTAESAPVSYSVVEGQKITPISDYLKKSNISQLSLEIGVSINF